MTRSLAMKCIDHHDIVIPTLERHLKLVTAPFMASTKNLSSRLEQSSPREQKPIVVIIDVLDRHDTASFQALADILLEEIPPLPPTIKFFLISRQVSLVDRYLSTDSIQRLTVDLVNEVNVQDCTTWLPFEEAHPGLDISSKGVPTQEITSRTVYSSGQAQSLIV